MPRLIINADDFGLTRGVNQAIAQLFRAGSLSSATIMVNGSAFQHAVAIAKGLPELGVGCHVVLVDGDPLCDPESIPTLIDSGEKRLRRSLGSFARAALLGTLNEADVEREASAQVRRLLEHGIRPTHLDTHKHTHVFPSILRPLLRVAEHFDIPAIRNPFEQAWSLYVGRGHLLRRLQVKALGLLEQNFHGQLHQHEGRIRTTDGAVGVSATGDLDARTLCSLLNKLPAGTWEFVCHPGFHDEDLDRTTTRLQAEREIEREALLNFVRKQTEKNRIELISFLALRSDT